METRIELAPNCSLTAAGAKLFSSLPACFSLAFSMIFAAMGFWPVLPFWALEMLALGIRPAGQPAAPRVHANGNHYRLAGQHGDPFAAR